MDQPTPPSVPPRPLAELRRLIDEVDEKLLKLLNERACLTTEVGDVKRATQPEAPFHAPAREQQILERMEKLNPGPFPTDALKRVYREIMSACLSLERPLRVAFLGPEGTFSHQAVKSQFGLSVQAMPQGSIPSVFQAVERGQADYGVAPVENATEGAVDPTLDTFLESQLRIVAEILLPVDLALLMRQDLEIDRIKRVYSHPQPFGQCQKWMAMRLPHVTAVVASSTTEAARMAREDAEGAAIASELAAGLFDLKVAAAGIQDMGGNATRFWVLGRKAPAPSGRDLTSLVVTVKDSPGVLLHLLEPLAKHNINLSRIQSRPTRRKAWEYAFFLDMEGHEKDPAVATALNELASVANSVKLLGSYPKAEEIER
jgi:chorismate mutase/prephenate dehydratase